MIFTIDIGGPDEDEVYEELVNCLQDMQEAGRHFEYDIIAVDVPEPQ